MGGTNSLDWTAIGSLAAIGSAVIAVASVAVALIGIWFQNRATLATTGIQLAWQLETRFTSDEFSHTRQAAAQALKALDGSHTRQSSGDIQAVADVLNFFDTVGLLTRKHAVDEQQIANLFGGWLIPYWLASNTIVESERQQDPSRWKEAEFLFQRFIGAKARQERHTVQDQIVAERKTCAGVLDSEIARGRRKE